GPSSAAPARHRRALPRGAAPRRPGRARAARERLADRRRRRALVPQPLL
ncbi:MAG: hypothetical protein AVDCRST_MAG35-845, partial [uncultured Quadrisphaera sp.]